MMNTAKKTVSANSRKIVPLVHRDDTMDRFLHQRLIVQTQNYIHLIDRDKIAYLQANGNYTRIVLTNGSSILSSRLLKVFEKQLGKHGFLRVHSSYLVNFKKIVAIRRNGAYKLVLENDMEIPVSHSNKEGLLDILRSATH